MRASLVRLRAVILPTESQLMGFPITCRARGLVTYITHSQPAKQPQYGVVHSSELEILKELYKGPGILSRMQISARLHRSRSYSSSEASLHRVFAVKARSPSGALAWQWQRKFSSIAGAKTPRALNPRTKKLYRACPRKNGPPCPVPCGKSHRLPTCRARPCTQPQIMSHHTRSEPVVLAPSG